MINEALSMLEKAKENPNKWILYKNCSRETQIQILRLIQVHKLPVEFVYNNLHKTIKINYESETML